MKCPKCNQEVEKWDEEQTNKIGECLSCRFWSEHFEDDKKLPPHTAVVIDGTHYVIGNESDPYKGFGGAEFQIEFFDGTRVVTHNLWCQGEPNEYWREKFPNNARFENNLKWTDINGTQYLIEEK